MKAASRPAPLPTSDVIEDIPSGSTGGTVPSADEVRDLMWRHVGVLRDRPSLERAVAELQVWAGAVAGRRPSRGEQPELRRVRSILTAGLLIARAALRRTESRGAHFRADFPSRDDLHWKTRTTERLHAD
jgi:succinate dehydrogenase/fumarate reductase flavoprotein subunit